MIKPIAALACLALLPATAFAMSKPPADLPSPTGGGHAGRDRDAAAPTTDRGHGGSGTATGDSAAPTDSGWSGSSDSPASVPEPGMLGLFALGALGIAVGRRLARRN